MITKATFKIFFRSLTLVLLFAIIAQTANAQGFLAQKDLSQFKVEMLSEADISKIKERIQSSEFTIDQLKAQAMAKGLSAAEFEKLRNFKTPKNSNLIGVFIVTSAGFFLLTSIFFLIQYFRRKENIKYSYVQLLLFPIGMTLFYYMIVLSGRINVFYFPAPYKDPTNIFVSLTSYIPFQILLLILPFSIINYKLLKESNWSLLAKVLFSLNNLIYIILIGLFAYWKFYDIFN